MATKFKYGSKFGRNLKGTKIEKNSASNDRDSDDNDFGADNDNDSDNGGDHGGRTVKARSQKLKKNRNDDDGHRIDSGNNDSGVDDSGADDSGADDSGADDPGEHNDDDDDVALDSKFKSGSGARKPGLKKRKDKTGDENEGGLDDGNDDGENDQEGNDNVLSEDPQQAAETIEEAFKVLGERPPPKLRRGKSAKRSDNEDLDNDEAADGEPNIELIEEIKAAMEEVDAVLEIQAINSRIVSPEGRRNAIHLQDPELAKQFSDACNIMMKDNGLKAKLSSSGIKLGAGGLKVLAVFGGIALVSGGAFLGIIRKSWEPMKVAVSTAEQLYNGAAAVGKKADQKLKKDALKKANAQQLVRLLGSNAINQTSLATFDRFRLMAATNLRANAEEGS